MPKIGLSFMLGDQHRNSSKSMRFPLRPGNGSIGDKCVVKANHLFVELSDNDIHQYDVTITPEVSPTSRANRAVMEQLVKLYRESDFGNRLPAYDGGKILYTAGPFPFLTKEFKVTILDDDGYGPRGKERQFKVVIKLVANVDLHQLRMFLQGRQAAAPQEALQCLNVVLRQLPSKMYCPVGCSFFSPHIGKINLLNRWVIWKGFHRNIRPTQMGLSVNIDMSSTLFISPQPVVKFVTYFLRMDDSSQPFTRSRHRQIENALRGVKVEVTHRGKVCRMYRVSGLTLKSTKELTFLVDDRGTTKSVVEYFQEKYGVVIQHTHWPCLQVGNQQKLIYLPMEVCNIVEGQRYSTEMLNVREVAALQNAKCQGPREREHDILKVVHYSADSKDPFLREFGLNMSEKLVSIDARVLSPPLLQYHKTGQEKDCLPRVGEWSMRNRKMVNGGAVHSWICINFAESVDLFSAERFCYYLGKMCHTCGMVYNPNPVFPVVTASPHLVESDFRDAMVNLEGKELDLVIVILPDRNDSLYGDVKRICETRYGIVSQCCLGKHVNTLRRQCLENMALKINVKVGGTNTVLVDAVSRRLPIVSERPTIVFGADVTHPPPGEKSSSPSIAAVVASQDWPAITKYASLVSAQSPGQELIQDLFNSSQDLVKGSVTGGMVRELLLSFYRATGHKPHRIIFYRDGISERQFFQILNHEFDAICKACTSLDPNYQPPVTFVVVQKRHHTRLFANNHGDKKTVDRSGNILPGTVVDSKICHPTEFDFYLCSHAGIQGTSRPTHYHVIWDENKFTPDGIQLLTNSLCYTYARCTRSVSIVTPVYYAHLAALRARCYIKPETSSSPDSSGLSGSPDPYGSSDSTDSSNPSVVRGLLVVKENLKREMYYI